MFLFFLLLCYDRLFRSGRKKKTNRPKEEIETEKTIPKEDSYEGAEWTAIEEEIEVLQEDCQEVMKMLVMNMKKPYRTF